MLANLFLFLMLSVLLKKNKKYNVTIWILYGLGILTALVVSSPDIIKDIVNGYNGRRVDFSFINANHSAALSGSVIMILNYYMINFFTAMPLSIKERFIKFVFLCLSYIPFVFVVIVTQSRQVWLALLIVLVFFSVRFLYIRYGFSFKRLLFVLLSTIIFFSFLTQVPIISKRINNESKVIQTISEGDLDSLPYSSVGIRIHFWLESVPWIKSYPILGAGDNARDLVIKQSPNLPESIKNRFSHLHNGFIELLVSYGILGTIFFVLVFYFLLTNIYSSGRNSDEFNLSLLFSIYFIVINMFESFLFFKTGLFMFSVFFGVGYSAYISEKLDKFDEVTK